VKIVLVQTRNNVNGCHWNTRKVTFTITRKRIPVPGLILVSVSHRIRTAPFLDRFSTSENSLCNVFHDQARRHMSELSVKFDITEVSSWHILRNVIHTSFFSCQ